MDRSASPPKMSASSNSPSPADKTRRPKYLVGTSGYSFEDWLGVFYPTRVSRRDMLTYYVRSFETVEINYSFYSMPTVRTLERLAKDSPPGFQFWIKANQQISHEGQPQLVEPFLDSLYPLSDNGKLAGVLLQFPQSFHRTVPNRKYLATLVEGFQQAPLAVEFRHRSWTHPDVAMGLRRANLSLVVPDVPPLKGLYICPAAATNRTGYLRLHSRNADKWYAGPADRYDYNYSEEELREVLSDWDQLDDEVDTVYAFFNNCHSGQAAQNAQAFRRILGQID